MLKILIYQVCLCKILNTKSFVEKVVEDSRIN